MKNVALASVLIGLSLAGPARAAIASGECVIALVYVLYLVGL